MQDSRARLLLSHCIEAGDPRLKAELALVTPQRLWDKIVAGQGVPEAWQAAALTAESRAKVSLERAVGAQMRWITPSDEEWPNRLLDLDGFDGINGVAGAPVGLWVAGEPALCELVEQSVAIVGARMAVHRPALLLKKQQVIECHVRLSGIGQTVGDDVHRAAHIARSHQRERGRDVADVAVVKRE